MDELERKQEGYQDVAASYLTAIFWQILRAVKEIPLPDHCASLLVQTFPEVADDSFSGQICRLISRLFPTSHLHEGWLSLLG
jgi:hypothetical protein